MHRAGRERERAGLERGSEGSLGVDLAGEDGLAGRGGVDGQGGSDRGLADTPLAGDEEQPVLDEWAAAAARLDQPPKPMCRSPSARPTST
jgi:hypothetical protein